MINNVHRSLVWIKYDGAELVDVELAEGRLTAVGTAIGADPVPFRLGYALITGENYVTRTLRVNTTGAGWRRSLELRRESNGEWRAVGEAEGELDAPAPGGDTADFPGVADCDLGLSPITHSLPVLRHGLLAGGEPLDLIVPSVAVPSLALRPLPVRYTHLRRDGDISVVRFEREGFSADLVFDNDGLVIDHPGVAQRPMLAG